MLQMPSTKEPPVAQWTDYVHEIFHPRAQKQLVVQSFLLLFD